MAYESNNLGARIQINSVPNRRVEALFAKIVIPSVVICLRPTFRWQNSIDYDGSVVSYQIQLSPDSDWGAAGTIVESNIVPGSGDYTDHWLDTELVQYQVYGWRVRAWDGYEWSEWSEPRGVVYSNKELDDLFAKIYVIDYENLPAKITVQGADTSDLPATVVTESDLQQLKAKIDVELEITDDLPAKVDVALGPQELPATITVVKPATEDLSAQVDVEISLQELKAVIDVELEVISDLPATITTESTLQHLTAKILIPTPDESDLDAKIDVSVTDQELKAKIFTLVLGLDSLSAKITNTSTLQQLPATITVWRAGEDDLPATITPVFLDDSDLAAKIKIVTYVTNNLLAKIFVIDYDDLPAKVAIVTTDDLAASITIEKANFYAKIRLFRNEDLPARINILKANFYAEITVLVDSQELPAQIELFSPGDLGAKIVIGDSDESDLPARITNTSTLQQLPATITVLVDEQELPAKAIVVKPDTSDLPARITLTGKLPAQLVVKVLGADDLPARLTIEEANFYAKINVLQSDESDLPASILVIQAGEEDLGAKLFVSYPPDDLDLAGYVVPTGYPPLPATWDDSGDAVPPRENQILSAKITVDAGDQHLPASITVESAAGEGNVNLYAKAVVVLGGQQLSAKISLGATLLPEAEWQDEDYALFVWDRLANTAYNQGMTFYVEWNDDPDYEITASDQLVGSLNYIDKTATDTGKWYFHVRGRNSYGAWHTETFHFELWYNNAPSAPTDLYVDYIGNISGITSTTLPTLIWTNTVDPDQLDVLTYNVEIEGQGGITQTLDFDSIPQAPSGSTTSFEITESLQEAGDYRWRVRAYDGKEYGEWSYWEDLTLVAISDDLPAQINIVTYQYKPLLAKIYVIDYEDLPARIGLETVENLPARISILKANFYAELTVDISLQELKAQIELYSPGDLGAKINISDTGTSNLPARLTNQAIPQQLPASITISVSEQVFPAKLVVELPDESDLGAKIRIVGKLAAQITVELPDTSDLLAKLTIEEANFYAKINVFLPESSDLSASILVMGEDDNDLSAKLYVTYPPDDLDVAGYVVPTGYPPLPATWDDSGDALPPRRNQILSAKITVEAGDQALPASITINSAAGEGNVNLYAQVTVGLGGQELVAKISIGATIIPEAEWQDEDYALFIWDKLANTTYNQGMTFYAAWNDNPSYEVTATDQLVGSLNYIDKTTPDTGKWYFHVRGRNSFGAWHTETFHVELWYNNKPTAPTALYVDDVSNISGETSTVIPILSWTNSYDPDQLDVLTYYVEIVKSGGGTYTFDSIPQNPSSSVTSFELTSPLPSAGIYTWRVRAWDGKEFGDWSLEEDLVIIPATSDIPAKLNVGTWLFTDLLAKIFVIDYDDLPAQIAIPRVEDLPARLVVTQFSDLPAKIDIPPGSVLPAEIVVMLYDFTHLLAKCTVEHSSDLPAKIEIPRSWDLRAKIIVSIDEQLLPAELTVVFYDDSDLPAKCRVVGPLAARITVVRDDYNDLPAKITPVLEDSNDLLAKISVQPYDDIKAQLLVSVLGQSNLTAQMDVEASRPDDVVVSANVAEAVWQEVSSIDFTWLPALDPWFTVSYFVQWNNDPNHEVTGADQNFGDALEATKVAYFSGHWYFHIRAKNSNGYWSENTTHYHIQYNRKPTAPTAPFLVEGELSGATIYTSIPEFTWTNATDQDQVDVLQYRLQVATDNLFANVVTDVTGIQQGQFSITEYQLLMGEKLPDAGDYFWRVLATDGKEEGPWGDVSTFQLVATTVDLSAKMNVPLPAIDNLSAKIYVVNYVELKAQIDVFDEETVVLEAKIVVTKYLDTDIRAKLFVPARSHLPAQLFIITYGDLNASLRVVGLPGQTDLAAKIVVSYPGSSDLPAKLRFVFPGDSDLEAIIFIPAHAEFPAEITVYTTESFGWIDDFSDNLPAKINISLYQQVFFQAKINVEESTPGPVTVFASIVVGTWQTEKDVRFFWDPAVSDFFPISGYHVRLDQTSNTNVTISDQKLISLEKIYDLEIEGGANSYWFHVAAVDTRNVLGPTTHVNVRYNHIPPDPIEPLLVNEIDSVTTTPIIGSQEDQQFAWGQSVDQDTLDVITYQIQISTNETFSNIVLNETGIPTWQYDLDISQLLAAGEYYWRVRAYDGHQWSGFSPVGSFWVNTPPEAPTELTVSAN